MSPTRPIAVRPAIDRRRLLSWRDALEPVGNARDQEQAAAAWLYAWSYEALRPTGELLAERLARPVVVRPARRVRRISPSTRQRSAAAHRRPRTGS